MRALRSYFVERCRAPRCRPTRDRQLRPRRADGCTQCSLEPLVGLCQLALRLSEPGLLSWTPSLLGLYGVQFQVTSIDPNSGVQFTTAPADLILGVVPACPTCPRPQLVLPENVTVPVGRPLSVPVEVTHATDGKPVMLTVFQAPDGVTLSPTAGSAPLQATLAWEQLRSLRGEVVDAHACEVAVRAVIQSPETDRVMADRGRSPK